MDLEEWRKEDVYYTRNEEGLREIMAPGDALLLRKRRRRKEMEKRVGGGVFVMVSLLFSFTSS